MKKNLNIILGILLTAAVIFIVYQNFLTGETSGSNTSAQKQLWICGMHPDIIMEEPGNCPICGMKLVPLKSAGSSSTGEKKIFYWRAPMDPNEIYDAPGKSKMGMDLVPVYENEEGGSGVVSIDPVVVQNMNVKTYKVQIRELSSSVTTNGVLTTRETGDYIVTSRVSGWVEKLYINYTGQKVSKGDKLMDIYSPELVAAQQELLSAISYNGAASNSGIKEISSGGKELIKNAERKLQLLEVSEKEIKELESSKEVKTYTTLYAQKDGTVITKNVTDGQKISAGMELLQISDLDILWLTADIYEYELGKISVGDEALIAFNFLPEKQFTGNVSFIYPTIDPKSRTAKVRIDVRNTNGRLKPAMLASITINGNNLGNHPVVPENAVIRSGKKDVVIIALGNGKFKPQQVMLGGYSEGFYQVLQGLSAGNEIVISAQFMIDSESNLKAAVNQYSSQSKFEKVEQTDKPKQMPEMEMGTKNDASEMPAMGNSPEIESKQDSGIDVKSYDKNGDGKVYECPMDWDVISDTAGRCPVCEMKLKEYSIDETVKNLKDHGYEVK